jgi:hypothetical protein
MTKESGERPIEYPEDRAEKKERAEYYLDMFLGALEDAENKIGVVDLDESSNNPDAQQRFKGDQVPTKGEVLQAVIVYLKEYIDYLDSEQRKVAEDAIIRAEIYLAAHPPII